ncbi:PP0621 family protein [Pseudomonas sp. GW6]
MGLFRLLFWVAVIFAAIWIWRRFISKAKPTRPTEGAAAPMVRCENCGVHIPKTQALSQDQRWYCSQKHLEQGPHTGDR